MFPRHLLNVWLFWKLFNALKQFCILSRFTFRSCGYIRLIQATSLKRKAECSKKNFFLQFLELSSDLELECIHFLNNIY